MININFDSKSNSFEKGDVVKLERNIGNYVCLSMGNFYLILGIQNDYVFIHDDKHIIKKYHHIMFEKDMKATREMIINKILQ